MDEYTQHEITREKALELYESRFWETMTKRQIAEFQMFTAQLCMPFHIFQEAMEDTLGRPIFTHEFGMAPQRLMRELRKEEKAPSFEDIVSLIPEEKRVVLIDAPGGCAMMQE